MNVVIKQKLSMFKGGRGNMQTRFFYIRKVRNNMTLKELSQLSGVPLPSIVKYDNGCAKIEKASYIRVIKIASVLKCRPEELIGYID